MEALGKAIYLAARYTIYAGAACKWARPRWSWYWEKEFDLSSDWQQALRTS